MSRSSATLTALSRLARQKRDLGDALFRFDYLPKAEDRVVAIICATEIEEDLESAITSKMVKLNQEEQRGLFSGDGPLATFSAKTKIAYALGIIGKNTRKDIDLIRGIRNAFAHSAKGIWFETEEIRHACEMLTAPERVPQIETYKGFAQPLDTARSRYMASAAIINHSLSVVAMPLLQAMTELSIMPLD